MEETLRDDFVRQGLDFLATPQVHSTLSSKVSFLESKGLSGPEIQEALSRLNRAGATTRAGFAPGTAPSPSLLHWFLSYVVAPLAVLGTGLIVFKLSGGEEEYPQDRASAQNNLLSETDSLSNAIHSRDNSSTSLIVFPHDDRHEHLRSDVEQEQPEWAKELQQMTAALTVEVQLVKAKLDQLAEIQTSAARKPAEIKDTVDNEAVSAEAESVKTEPISVELRQQRIHEAITNMQELSKNTSASEDIKKCCSVLTMYFSMLLDQPDIPRYRKIAVNNDSFKSSVQTVAGHDKLFESAGFERRGMYYEWTWFPSNVSSSPSLASTNEVDKESRVLLLKWILSALEMVKANGAEAKLPEFDSGEKSSSEISSVAPLPVNHQEQAQNSENADSITTFAEIASRAKIVQQESATQISVSKKET